MNTNIYRPANMVAIRYNEPEKGKFLDEFFPWGRLHGNSVPVVNMTLGLLFPNICDMNNWNTWKFMWQEDYLIIKNACETGTAVPLKDCTWNVTCNCVYKFAADVPLEQLKEIANRSKIYMKLISKASRKIEDLINSDQKQYEENRHLKETLKQIKATIGNLK